MCWLYIMKRGSLCAKRFLIECFVTLLMYLREQNRIRQRWRDGLLCFLMTDGETVCNKPNYWLLFDMLFTVNVRGSFEIHVRFNIPKIKIKTPFCFLSCNQNLISPWGHDDVCIMHDTYVSQAAYPLAMQELFVNTADEFVQSDWLKFRIIQRVSEMQS